MDYKEILFDITDNIATITLHRPDKLNAFTNTMMREVISAFDTTDADDSVRAVIVTGSGRGFCAGADLSGGGDTFRVAEVMSLPSRALLVTVEVWYRCVFSRA